MFNFKKALASVAALTMLSTGPSHAASLQTDIDVNLPSVIALYCYDEIDVTVSAANFITAVGGTDGESATTGGDTAAASAAAGAWTAAFTGLDTEDADVDTDVNLNMTGVCAFRAIGAAGGVTVSITTEESTLTGSGGAEIEVGTAVARRAGSGAAYAASYDVTPANLGWGTVSGIDIQLPLDLSNAGASGDYSSATDGTFEVTVVAKP